MKLFKSIFRILISLSFIFSNNSHIIFEDNDSIQISVIEQNKNYVIVRYQINDYFLSEYDYNGEIFHTVSIDGEPNHLVSGEPDLPHINRSLIIPDYLSGNISIVNTEYIELENINVIPSKGNITRNIDINLVPYIKGGAYIEDNFSPLNIAQLNDPYILRDFRGQVVQVNPLQYNPVTKNLKLYTDITLKIEFTGLNSIYAVH